MKSQAILTKISARVAEIDPASDRTIFAVFEYKIKTADGVHSFFMDLKNLKTGDSTTEKIDVTIEATDDDFVFISTNKLGVKDAIAQGKMTVTGNIELVEKLFAKNQ